VPTIWSVRVCAAGRLEGPGDAEVDHLGAAGREQHVARLEVAVDHAGAVDRGQRGGHPDRDAVQVGRGERAALLDHLGEAGPVHVLDDQVRLLVVGVGVEHLGGAERRHLPGPVDLAAEPAPELVVGARSARTTLTATSTPAGLRAR
jgi:hypothetical protein